MLSVRLARVNGGAERYMPEDAREDFLRYTCDTELNARDIDGDGDQSLIQDPRKQFNLKDVWMALHADFSGDVGGSMQTSMDAGRMDDNLGFWWTCWFDDYDKVKAKIYTTRRESGTAFRQLLERRQTPLRLSPLNAIIYASRTGHFNVRYLDGRKIVMIDLDKAVDNPGW